MPKRQPRSALTLLASLFLAIGLHPAVAQTTPAATVQTRSIADGVFMLEGRGGNIGVFVVGNDMIVVDSQYAAGAAATNAALNGLGTSVRYLVNTHWHHDHSEGNDAVRGTGRIVAHRNTAALLASGGRMDILRRDFPPLPLAARADILVGSRATLKVGGKRLILRHMPRAHTAGDLIVVDRAADVIHTGDLFFNGTYPVIDTTNGGTIRGMIRAADKIAALAGQKTKIIPGHGPLADRAALMSFRGMLAKLETRIEQAVSSGMTLGEFLATNPTTDLDPVWGGGFMKGKPLMEALFVAASARR